MPGIVHFMRCIGRAVVKNGCKALASLVPFGEVLFEIATDAIQEYRQDHGEADLRADLQQAAQASLSEVRQATEQAVALEAADQPPEIRLALATYLNQIPATIRQSLRRPSDPGGTTVPPTQSLRKPVDLLPFLPAALPRFKAGDQPLAADWELVEMLGKGGFGEVWKARHLTRSLQKPVALKFCLDPEAAHSIRNEAAIHNMLDRVRQQGGAKGFVPLLETYLRADPPCLMYELIEGGDLTGFIQEMHQTRRLNADFATKIVHRLASTVTHAHRLDPPLVHRDLKPSNVLLRRGEGNKLALFVADFGIGGLAARQSLQEQATRQSVRSQTLPAAVRGAYTPLYASPQQVQGEKPDPRDDVHALGVIWYQLVTGDLKMVAIPPDWREVVKECGLGEDHAQLLASCIASRSQSRLPSAAALGERLTALADQRASQAAAEEKRHEEEAARQAREREERVQREQREAERKREEEKSREREQARLAEIERREQEEEARQKEELRNTAELAERLTAHQTREIAVTPTAEAHLKLPSEITNSIGMKFVLIPAGTFRMGSPDSEEDRSSDEGPVHEVEITRAFYLGVHPVTQEQYEKVMGNNPSYFSANGGGNVRGLDTRSFPVEQVSWEDAQAFLQKLTVRQEEKEKGRIYRLPTEAEWEYSCRGGLPSQIFHFGNTLTARQANFENTLGRTCEVGSYPANAFGLFDMHGNVWEWCADWYDGKYYASSPKRNPAGPPQGTRRVVRGGSWGDVCSYCRSAGRHVERPADSCNDLGFRVALVPSRIVNAHEQRATMDSSSADLSASMGASAPDAGVPPVVRWKGAGMPYYNCPSCGQKNVIRKQSLGTIRECRLCNGKVAIPEVTTQEELNGEMKAKAAELRRLAAEQARIAEEQARVAEEQAKVADEQGREQARINRDRGRPFG